MTFLTGWFGQLRQCIDYIANCIKVNRESVTNLLQGEQLILPILFR